MRGKELLDYMELADFAYVEAADAVPRKKNHTKPVILAVAAAACLAAGLAVYLHNTQMPLPRPDGGGAGNGTVLIGGIERNYKKQSASTESSAIVWPWEYQTVEEQYTSLLLDGNLFDGRCRTIDSALLGERIGTGDAFGYDTYTDQTYHRDVEVRRINSVCEEWLVAADLDGTYYVFLNHQYNSAPPTFGELLDDCSLSETLSLTQYTVYDGFSQAEETICHQLEEDAPIWEILKECRDAAFVNDNGWFLENKQYFSFTATSEVLGIENRVFYVTSDGYIQTNIMDYAYTYEIGSEAAGRILSYAQENSTAVNYTWERQTLAGTVTSIQDGYLYLDDAILCVDPNTHMLFKVPLDDLKISRHIDFEGIGVGDFIQISFTGNIQTDEENLVPGVYEMSRAILSEGKDVLVNE